MTRAARIGMLSRMKSQTFFGKFRILILVTLACTFASGSALAQAPGATSKRVTYYYQTQYYNGNYVSLSPIWNQINPKTGKPVVTDVMVAAFHLGYNSDNTPYIHLNDNVPSDPMFTQMWQEVATLQSYGVTVRMMLGGAAQGSYADLFNNWSTFYPILMQTLQQYNLDGIDMDIEETVSLSNAQMLIDQLNTDFGPNFIMTMAPVATALTNGPNLSGFNYEQLSKSKEGKRLNWYNVQFYSGFGSMATPTDYEQIIQFGYPPSRIVAGMIGNPADGNGYVSYQTTAQTIRTLVTEYPTFGGADSWEYFNTLPGGLANPVQWAEIMAKAMK